MKLPVACTSVLLFCLICRVQAQEDSSTEKTAHLTGPAIQRRAPEYAVWTITTVAADKETDGQAPAPEQSPKATPKKRSKENKEEPPPGSTPSSTRNPSEPFSVLTFTKTGQIMHIERQERRSQTSNVWVVGGHEFALSEDGKSAVEVAPPTSADSANPLFTDLAKTDFTGFEWISAKNYVGVDDVGGRPCLIFREETKESGNRQANGDPVAPSRYAAVDYYSRLPVALATNGERQEYVFKFPPVALQTPPEPVSRSARELSETKKDTERTPSKPF